MSNLIITLISIALIGLVALSTLFFGGDAFNRGAAKAAANTLINQASQIDGANTLYFQDNQEDAADVGTLVSDSYLGSAPNPGEAGDTWSIANGVSTSENVRQATCDAVNEVAGTDELAETDLAATLAEMDTQFGCHAVGGTLTFVHK